MIAHMVDLARYRGDAGVALDRAGMGELVKAAR